MSAQAGSGEPGSAREFDEGLFAATQEPSGGRWSRKKADATARIRREERKSFCSRLDKVK